MKHQVVLFILAAFLGAVTTLQMIKLSAQLGSTCTADMVNNGECFQYADLPFGLSFDGECYKHPDGTVVQRNITAASGWADGCDLADLANASGTSQDSMADGAAGYSPMIYGATSDKGACCKNSTCYENQFNESECIWEMDGDFKGIGVICDLNTCSTASDSGGDDVGSGIAGAAGGAGGVGATGLPGAASGGSNIEESLGELPKPMPLPERTDVSDYISNSSDPEARLESIVSGQLALKASPAIEENPSEGTAFAAAGAIPILTLHNISQLKEMLADVVAESEELLTDRTTARIAFYDAKSEFEIAAKKAASSFQTSKELADNAAKFANSLGDIGVRSESIQEMYQAYRGLSDHKALSEAADKVLKQFTDLETIKLSIEGVIKDIKGISNQLTATQKGIDPRFAAFAEKGIAAATEEALEAAIEELPANKQQAVRKTFSEVAAQGVEEGTQTLMKETVQGAVEEIAEKTGKQVDIVVVKGLEEGLEAGTSKVSNEIMETFGSKLGKTAMFNMAKGGSTKVAAKVVGAAMGKVAGGLLGGIGETSSAAVAIHNFFEEMNTHDAPYWAMKKQTLIKNKRCYLTTMFAAEVYGAMKKDPSVTPFTNPEGDNIPECDIEMTGIVGYLNMLGINPNTKLPASLNTGIFKDKSVIDYVLAKTEDSLKKSVDAIMEAEMKAEIMEVNSSVIQYLKDWDKAYFGDPCWAGTLPEEEPSFMAELWKAEGCAMLFVDTAMQYMYSAIEAVLEDNGGTLGAFGGTL